MPTDMQNAQPKRPNMQCSAVQASNCNIQVVAAGAFAACSNTICLQLFQNAADSEAPSCTDPLAGRPHVTFRSGVWSGVTARTAMEMDGLTWCRGRKFVSLSVLEFRSSRLAEAKYDQAPRAKKKLSGESLLSRPYPILVSRHLAWNTNLKAIQVNKPCPSSTSTRPHQLSATAQPQRRTRGGGSLDRRAWRGGGVDRDRHSPASVLRRGEWTGKRGGDGGRRARGGGVAVD